MSGRTRTVSYAATDEELFREQMRSSAQGDGAHPRTFAYLLVKGAENRIWERLTDSHGEPFGSFGAFLEARVEDGGLGMTKDELKHAAALAGAEALTVALRLLKEETSAAAGPGRPMENVGGTNVRDVANTAEHIVARLKRDDPTLAERVVNGEISANAAAREKGWRRPRIVVSSPERVAEALQRLMPPEDIARLIALLMGGDR